MAVPPANALSDRFRKQREHTRAELLDSARRVLSAKGFHRTKVADIAREARVAVGTFYLYYPTKEALFVELVHDTVHLLQLAIDTALAGAADPRQRTRIALATFFHFAQQHHELFRIVFGHGATFHDVVRRTQQWFADDIARNFSEGIHAAVFRPNNPAILAQAFIGMSLQVVSWWLEHAEVPMNDVIDSLLDLVSHGTQPSPDAER